jgi:acyl carrier protein
MNDDKLAGCLAAVNEVFGGTVNPDQGFYDLGGNSLHAIQLTVRVRELTGIEVNPYDMANAQSLAKFFEHCIDSE